MRVPGAELSRFRTVTRRGPLAAPSSVLGTAGLARRERRLRRVRAGQPALVGRRRRRLPGRARPGHRRRRLRVVPGGAARGRRPAARRRGRGATCWRSGPARRRARAGCAARARGRWRWTCPAACCGTRPRWAPRPASPVPLVQAGAERLPFRAASFDLACSAFGAVPFVADPGRVMAEVARVLRPGGRWVFAVNHPMRWVFSDDPGPGRADRAAVLLRPHALRRGRRGRRGHLRRAPPHGG